MKPRDPLPAGIRQRLDVLLARPVFRQDPGLTSAVTTLVHDAAGSSGRPEDQVGAAPDGPGHYGPVMAWLAEHPRSTLQDICAAAGVTRERAQLILRHAEKKGIATRTGRDRPDRPAWLWSVVPASAPDDSPAVTPDISEAFRRLDELKARLDELAAGTARSVPQSGTVIAIGVDPGPTTGILLVTAQGAPGACPDGGTCHHDCGPGTCFRVHFAGPLSGIYPADTWPDSVRAGYPSGGHL